MEVTVVPGVPRYHNASCILIRFMGDSDLDKMPLAAAREIGCTPCRACLPDQPDKSPELPDASRASPRPTLSRASAHYGVDAAFMPFYNHGDVTSRCT
jgi:hypothetical protein